MEEKEKVSKNFIEMAIDKDLEEGVYDHVMTRFPALFLLQCHRPYPLL